MTVRTAASVRVGDTFGPITVPVSRQSLVDYAAASGDDNPIHQNEEFARGVGLPDVIAHGMFTMGAAITVVTEWVGDAGAVVRYGTRFTKPVVVPYETGADVRFSATVTAVDEPTRQATIEITATCGPDKVLGRAAAVVRLA